MRDLLNIRFSLLLTTQQLSGLTFGYVCLNQRICLKSVKDDDTHSDFGRQHFSYSYAPASGAVFDQSVNCFRVKTMQWQLVSDFHYQFITIYSFLMILNQT